jgi:hypothetical protein
MMAKQQCTSPTSISKTAWDEFSSSEFPILKTGFTACKIRHITDFADIVDFADNLLLQFANCLLPIAVCELPFDNLPLLTLHSLTCTPFRYEHNDQFTG